MILVAHHPPSRAAQHRVAGGGVPFHRAPEARVEVGLAGRDEAELERRARGDDLAGGVAGEVVVGGGVPVRLGGDDAQRAVVGGGDADRRGRARRVRIVRAGLLDRDAGCVRVEQAPLGRRVDHAAHRGAVHHQRDVDGEVAAPPHELLGAVERVDDQEGGGRLGMGRGLLLGHEHRVRERRAQAGGDDRVGGLVGTGDGAVVVLGPGAEVAAPVDLHDRGAGFEREPAGDAREILHVHRAPPWRRVDAPSGRTYRGARGERQAKGRRR